MLLKVIPLFYLIHSVFTQDLLKPCPVEDIECLSQTTENFLDQTAGGIPNLDIRPIDPLFIDMVCSKQVDGVMVHYTNITITGFRKQKISGFAMDTKAKSVLLSMTMDAHIDAGVTLEYEETKKSYTGHTSISGKVAVTLRYSYDVTKDDKGVEHFEAGPETLTCEFSDPVQVQTNKEFLDHYSTDEHALKLYNQHKDEYNTLRKKHACDVIKAGYATVMHNMRAAAKAYPKSAFFTNV